MAMLKGIGREKGKMRKVIVEWDKEQLERNAVSNAGSMSRPMINFQLGQHTGNLWSWMHGQFCRIRLVINKILILIVCYPNLIKFFNAYQ
jgi:hypothetical protein